MDGNLKIKDGNMTLYQTDSPHGKIIFDIERNGTVIDTITADGSSSYTESYSNQPFGTNKYQVVAKTKGEGIIEAEFVL
jgi:hypothetical protein